MMDMGDHLTGTQAGPSHSDRLARFAATAILVLGLVEGAALMSRAVGVGSASTMGSDLRIYTDRATSWIAGDGFYRDRQLGGPYVLEDGDALYPPPTLLLFVPFTVLPSVLWWAIPLGILAAAVRRARPTTWGYAVMAVPLLYPRTWALLLYGNPAIWSLAAVAAGAVWKWPAALVLVKPTVVPFALLGIRDRRWWLLVVVLLVAAVPFGAMWIDYAHVLIWTQNTAPGSINLWGEWPIALALVVALRSRRTLDVPQQP